MASLMIDLTDYHVSRTLGYIDTYIRFPDAIGGFVTPGPIQVPMTPDILAVVDQLDALLASAVQAQLVARPGADPSLTVTPMKVDAMTVAQAVPNG